MPRRLHIELDVAIYHVIKRRGARQNIVHDQEDRQRLIEDPARTVARFGLAVTKPKGHASQSGKATHRTAIRVPVGR